MQEVTISKQNDYLLQEKLSIKITGLYTDNFEKINLGKLYEISLKRVRDADVGAEKKGTAVGHNTALFF